MVVCVCASQFERISLSYSAGGNIRVSLAVAAAAVDMNMLMGRRSGAALRRKKGYCAPLCSPRVLNFDAFGQSLPQNATRMPSHSAP